MKMHKDAHQKSRCLPRLWAANLCQGWKQLAKQGAAHPTIETPFPHTKGVQQRALGAWKARSPCHRNRLSKNTHQKKKSFISADWITKSVRAQRKVGVTKACHLSEPLKTIVHATGRVPRPENHCTGDIKLG